jgi:hypothetical protein
VDHRGGKSFPQIFYHDEQRGGDWLQGVTGLSSTRIEVRM